MHSDVVCHCTRAHKNAHNTHMHADLKPLSCGKWSRCKLWPWHKGSKVKKFVFPGLPLIIYSWNKEEGVERLGKGERPRNPPVWGLWCWKQNLLFNLPSNGIHMTQSAQSPIQCLPPLPLSVFFWVYLFVFACDVHVHMVCVMSTHVWDRSRVTCNRLNTQGGNGQRKY